MNFKNLSAAFVVGFLMIVAAPRAASAATISFNTCDNQPSLCGHLFLATTLNGGPGGTITVSVFSIPGTDFGIFDAVNAGKNGAFAMNIGGSIDGLAFSNVTPGFSGPDATNGKMNGYGDFEYLFSGPGNGSNAFLPFSFTVSRTGGFATETEIFELNSKGFFAAAHFLDENTGLNDFVASNTTPCIVDCATPLDSAPVPEPASMLLLGTGLLAVARARRKKTS